MKNLPKVSTIITNYNKGPYIEEAIESVVKQTYPNIEIIVVDDKSTDGSVEIIENVIKKYKDKDIKLIKHSENLGSSAARNSGIKASTGEYIQFLDADDYYLENRTEFLVNKIGKKDFVITNYYGMNNSKIYIIDHQPDLVVNTLNRKKVLQKLFVAPVSFPMAALFKKDFIYKVGLFREDIQVSEDWEFLFRCYQYGDFKKYNVPLMVFRFNPTSKTLSNVKYIRENHDRVLLEKAKSLKPEDLFDENFGEGYANLAVDIFNYYFRIRENAPFYDFMPVNTIKYFIEQARFFGFDNLIFENILKILDEEYK